MELWKFLRGRRVGSTAVLLRRYTIESAGGQLHWMCELLAGDKLIELPEAALHELAELVEPQKER